MGKRTLILAFGIGVWFLVPVASVAQQATLIKGVLGDHEFSEVASFTVLRSSPWVSRSLTVTPERIVDSYTAMAAIKKGDAVALRQLNDALKSAGVDSCYGENYSFKGFPASWALLLYDATGKTIGALYLDERGLCAAVDGKVIGVEPSLIIYLRRTFAFMNY
jgi:hypothetical protein